MENIDITAATAILIIWCVACWVHAAMNLLRGDARSFYARNCSDCLSMIAVAFAAVFFVVTAPIGIPFALIKRTIKAND